MPAGQNAVPGKQGFQTTGRSAAELEDLEPELADAAEDDAAPAPVHEVHARELMFVGGGSDKFYRVFVDGSSVSAQYGRNGTPGSWTAPKEYADPETAMKAADKIVASKMAKGYDMSAAGVMAFDGEPGEDDLVLGMATIPDTDSQSVPQVREQSAIVVSVNRSEVDETAMPRVVAALEEAGLRRRAVAEAPSPTRPMLARTIEPDELRRALADPNWVVQDKLDGDRVCIVVQDGQVSVLNRQGQPKARNVSESMVAPFRGLTQGRWVFDGEAVGQTMHVFDMPAAGGFHDESAPYEDRARALGATLTALGVDRAAIRPVATAQTETEKRGMLAAARQGRREGIILRRRTAGYENGRRSESLLKAKFAREVDAEIVEMGTGGKSNAVLAVRRPDGSRQVIGQVSTIGRGDLKVGDVVETRFLNVADPDNPTLFQPRILRKRTDKSAEECSADQLANAAMDREYGE